MNYDKIVGEYSAIEETDFWKSLIKEIKAHRDLLSGMCETKENPTSEQGGVKAIDFILGRDYFLGRNKYPNVVVRILENSRKSSQKGV
jgi:phage host-nuclease inhibitor protein Gam